MKLRFPLYAKILLWFFLNLAAIGLVFLVFFRPQFRLGLDSLLTGQASDRIQALSEVISLELNHTPRPEWDDLLKRFSGPYQMQFSLFGNEGGQMAGPTMPLPPQVQARLNERRAPRPPRPGGPRGGPPESPDRGPDRQGEPRRGDREPTVPARLIAGQFPKFIVHTDDPSRYWMIVRIPLPDAERRHPFGATLIGVSESIRGGGLFFDFTPWLLVGFGVLFLSVLFWLPLVRSITRSISEMTHATEQIAEGRFDVALTARRTDELGRLAQAINRMAGRLAGFVTGQKRFLGDIAHELCSPLARIQMALGILDQQADDKQRSYVEDVREEVQHMTSLVNELLSFSKAGLRQKEATLEPVQLAALARRVIEREASDRHSIEVSLDESLHVMAEPELLSRGLANLVRNALRYAGDAGPIRIAARLENARVLLTVSDAGPGVPPELLDRLFEPFFRPDAARSRDTGGTGLGLAIVKSCVEACQGTVTCRNLQPKGFAVEISLAAAATAHLRIVDRPHPIEGRSP